MIIPFCFCSCLFAVDPRRIEGPLYTAYNLWYEKPDVMWSANYRKGILIPAGSEVTSLIFDDRRGRRVKMCEFEIKNINRIFAIHFTPKHHTGLKRKDFVERLFTKKNLKELTAGFSPLENKCIKEGIVKPSMRKEAVIVVYGYPPETLTRSTKDNTWYYWKSRFDRQIIRFNEDGIVEGVVN